MCKYQGIRDKYLTLEKELNNIIDIDPGNYKKINVVTKEIASIKQVYNAILVYDQYQKERKELKDFLLNDDSMKEECRAMISELDNKIEEQCQEIDSLLLSQDKDMDKNAYIEIRSGVGGNEASLFVSDILQMYMRYAERMNWRCETSSLINKLGGGIKEVTLFIKGKNVYGCLHHESGGHRVQRIPETESSGRVHTSLITVAVLPEVEDVEVELSPSDLRITTCKSSGAGGQHVNTTDSAVSILHIPTGIVVEQSSERSQHQNKAKALKLLRAKLYDKSLRDQQAKIAQDRKEQVGSGDRSDKIRTYNFPQSRVTDHRINLTLYKLNAILKEGQIDEFITELKKLHISQK